MMNWLRKNRSILLYMSNILLLVASLCWIMNWSFARTRQENVQRSATICPSLLSVGRSARDTLIIMRNETLCTAYVLDNLK